MAGNEAGQAIRGFQLLPHQASLVEQIAGSAEPKVIGLEGDVGLGKSVTLAAACARVITIEPSARALLLVPSRALGEQFVSLLHSLDSRAVLVDRYRLREMLDAASGPTIWPEGEVSVLNWELAGQPDVASTLQSTRWAIVVVDEAHAAAERVLKFLRSLSHVANRVVLATATLPRYDFAALLGQPVDHVRWRREDVLARSALNRSLPPAATFNKIVYSRSDAEQALDTLLDAVSNAVDPLHAAVLLENLKRSGRSGPTALENALRSLLQRDGTADLLDDLEERADEDGQIDRSAPLFRRVTL